jgi:hypothetical protein
MRRSGSSRRPSTIGSQSADSLPISERQNLTYLVDDSGHPCHIYGRSRLHWLLGRQFQEGAVLEIQRRIPVTINNRPSRLDLRALGWIAGLTNDPPQLRAM